MDRCDLKSLAQEISDMVSLLSDELTKSGLREPTLEHGLPTSLQRHPESAASIARQKLLQLVEELQARTMDPALLLTTEMRNPIPSLHPIVRLGIAEAVPAEGATVQAVAEKTGVREDLVRRLLCHCATHHIYFQTRPDFFVHTAASRIVAENEGMRNWILIGATEMLPATLKTAEALLLYPESEEPEHCGWSIQERTDKSIFKALADQPDRAMIFADAMRWHSQQEGFALQHLLSSFPWGEKGKELLIVDVGGGQGHVSRALASHDSMVKCIVQDFPEPISQGKRDMPSELQTQISFQPHDFFNDQPVRGADVYLLRLILHDWSDRYARKIVKAQVPALKHGAKVVLHDRVMPAFGEASLLQERENRDYDMYMLAFQNARERTVTDWIELFKGVSSNFQFTEMRQPPSSHLALLEFTWNGTATTEKSSSAK